MKFSLIASVLAATAAASPSLVERNPSLVERDVAAFTSVIASIQSQVNTLNTAIQGYNGGIPVSIEQDSNQLVTTINNGANTLKSQPDLSDTDTLSLVTPVEALSSSVTATINNLISKKSLAEQACLGQVVLDDLNQQKSAAQSLASTIASKVSTDFMPTAQALGNGIVSAIQKGIDAYANPPACSSSGSTGGTTSSSSSASTTGSSTTTTGAVVPPVSSSTPSTTPAPTTGGSSPSTTGVTPISSNAAALSGVSAPVALAALAAVFAF